MRRVTDLERTVTNSRTEIPTRLLSGLEHGNHGNLRQDVKTAWGPKTKSTELIESELLNYQRECVLGKEM